MGKQRRMHAAVAARSRQRGLSFIGVVLLGALIVAAFAVGGQAFPMVLEYQAARKAIDKAKAGTTVGEVRAIFDHAAAIDDIASISGKDLEVTKNGDKVVVSFAYERQIHLAGPAYLTFKFSERTN